MNTTQWAAWVGATSGVVSLLWNIYVKISSGPRLRVSAYAGMVKMPPPPGNPEYLSITVRNVGSVPTTMRNVSFHRYDSFWTRVFRKRTMKKIPTYSAVLNLYEGPRYPVLIEVGSEWVGFMKEDEQFRQLLSHGDVWVAVHHSFSTRPVEVKITHIRAADPVKSKSATAQ